jgi:uncharacterized caspase-like protein
MHDTRFLHKTSYAASHALVIGINKYESAPPLSYAVSDAEAIRDVLLSEFAFPKANVTCLLDEKATKQKILQAFMRFSQDDMSLDDRVLIFFAGHGHTLTGNRGEVGFLVPYDANLSDASTFIRWKELTDGAELIRAKHMLFIMDACYSGLALTRGLHAGSTRFLKDMLLRHSRQAITAGKADETVSDSGGPLPNHSVFTGHLLEGLQGNAETGQGILTASTLMSYVYGKVANDKNSNQTPHYGHFDGDGDFVFKAPQLTDLETSDLKDIDRLIVVPFSEEITTVESTTHKINKVKTLLATDGTSIELHDYMVTEVRRFFSNTSEDNFKVQGQFSKEELLARIADYEQHSNDLAALTACLAYWAKPIHKGILQKVIARSADRLETQSGLVIWLNLRWYPLIVSLYCAGIAAVEGKRYDSLANLFYTSIGSSEYSAKTEFFADAVANAILELARADAFKQLPGHEKQYTPMSEYLFKSLQPKLDDLLFVGKGYENAFDEFEVMFALVVADIKKQRDSHVWGPIGRFGWKRGRGDSGPLDRVISHAKSMGEKWGPLEAGLFGGSSARFNAVADEYTKGLSTLNWW